MHILSECIGQFSFDSNGEIPLSYCSMWESNFPLITMQKASAQTTRPLVAAPEYEEGANGQRPQTGQCQLFSRQLWRRRDEKQRSSSWKSESREVTGCQGAVTCHDRDSLRQRKKKVVCRGQRATMYCYAFEGGKKKAVYLDISVSDFWTLISCRFSSSHHH